MGVFFNFNLGGERTRWGVRSVGSTARYLSNKYLMYIRKAFMPRTPYKKAQKYKDSFLCSNEIIISTKEARKLLGKADSDKISDLELANLIGLMHRIASDLIDIKIVHSGEKVV